MCKSRLAYTVCDEALHDPANDAHDQYRKEARDFRVQRRAGLASVSDAIKKSRRTLCHDQHLQAWKLHTASHRPHGPLVSSGSRTPVELELIATNIGMFAALAAHHREAEAAATELRVRAEAAAARAHELGAKSRHIDGTLSSALLQAKQAAKQPDLITESVRSQGGAQGENESIGMGLDAGGVQGIQVVVGGGRHMPKMDSTFFGIFGGKCDPYVKLSCGGVQTQTKVVATTPVACAQSAQTDARKHAMMAHAHANHM